MITAEEFLPDNIYVRLVGILMGTKCAPLIADLFLYCFELQLTTACQQNIFKTGFRGQTL